MALLRMLGLGKHGGVLHLLVGSTGLKPCGAGRWLVGKHGTKTRRCAA